jgi:hypothetical protein
MIDDLQSSDGSDALSVMASDPRYSVKASEEVRIG